MTYREMKDIVRILSEEWNLGKKESGAEGDICSWIYLFQILEESEKLIKVKEGNKIIGLCGYSKFNSRKYKLRKKFYKLILNKLYKSKKIKNLQALKEYEENYSYMPESLKEYFDGEITILIVDKNHRGKNLGRKMINNVFELARIDNLNKIKIVTDFSCNHEFYSNVGCDMIYKTIVKNKEEEKSGNQNEVEGYIFEKKLN